MKKMYAYIFLVLLVCFAHINGTEKELIPKDYSTMSQAELDTAFVLAVRQHRLDEMQKLLKAGANVDTPIHYTWTEADCDWNVQQTPLEYAIQFSLPKIIKMLSKSVKKDLLGALEAAIREGYSDSVQELIEEGVDVNGVCENGDTPLIIAIDYARATSEFSRQAQAQERSRWRQRREIIQTLLAAGAKVSHANKFGRTALMVAVLEYDLNTVQKLLQIPEMNTGSWFGFGTKPLNYADQDGNTALMLALKNVRTSYISGDSQEYNICLNSQNIIQTLLNTPGIDPYHANKKGDTAIKQLEWYEARRKRGY